MPRALITGITGQDGSYLAEFLLNKGYEVYGVTRRSSTVVTDRISHLLGKIQLLSGDLLDQASLIQAVQESQPDEVYNLAAQSFVQTSWVQPAVTAEFTALGVVRLLEAVRMIRPRARFYQASTSEMFGKVQAIPQNEQTAFYPRSPYGISKLFGHWSTVNYRESFGFFGCSGILFNHESPRRGLEFVTRKISSHVALIKMGLKKHVYLGNLEAQRDWGYAGDFVEAMWLMLQQENPDDYVVGTGETHTVREFASLAFERVGLDWKDHVRINEQFYRPAEVDLLVADSTKARKVLGWSPKTKFRDLVHMMVDSDLARLHRDLNVGPKDRLASAGLEGFERPNTFSFV